jgi:hypothetical protein
MGIQIGAGDEQLKRFSAEQMIAATALVACESTSSCSLNDSTYLQGQCVFGGMCSNTLMDYFREHGLPPSAMADISIATARLSELIAQGRWDLIGYAPTNVPVQNKPSVLPSKPPLNGTGK